ncbi:MAG: MerR family transcriptional regulator [Lachnospiraceae bacterium]|nr:MerR family transcriptional regulator [Robinsoniella sp.]MDY3766568.1 MerR family transcriptional regulator [Lachnospiraceae bacterium]
MKQYTIKEVSHMMNLPASTIRYYDKEGLLPFIERSESGYRVFHENDITLLRVIECLKKTGMPIKEIHQFIEWIQQGDDSLEQRYQMFVQRKQIVKDQIAELSATLEIINYKCQYYAQAIAAGTEQIHFQGDFSSKLPCEK